MAVTDKHVQFTQRRINSNTVYHISSAGEGNREPADATNSRGLKNGVALRIVTVFVQQAPPHVLICSSFSSSLHAQNCTDVIRFQSLAVSGTVRNK